MENLERARNSVTELGKSIKNNIRSVKRKASHGALNVAGIKQALVSRASESTFLPNGKIPVMTSDLIKPNTKVEDVRVMNNSSAVEAEGDLPRRSIAIKAARNLMATSQSSSSVFEGINLATLNRLSRVDGVVAEVDEPWKWREIYAEVHADSTSRASSIGEIASDDAKFCTSDKQMQHKILMARSSALSVKPSANGQLQNL